jgi:hypothetical protein
VEGAAHASRHVVVSPALRHCEVLVLEIVHEPAAHALHVVRIFCAENVLDE